MTVARDFREVDFRRYLLEAGVDFQAVTNPYEVIRYRRNGACGIVYRNAKGRITLTGDAEKMWDALKSGRPSNDPLPEQNAPRRRVQLYTDASSYCETMAGAWAAILVLTNDEAHEAHGRLRGDIRSSTSAEARAVANGLHHFLRAGLIKPRDVITVILDNQAVVRRVGSKGRSKRPDVQEALAAIHKLASAHALKISGEWIKGHQPAAACRADPRVTFNRRCDALCSQHGKSLHRERIPSRASRTHAGEGTDNASDMELNGATSVRDDAAPDHTLAADTGSEVVAGFTGASDPAQGIAL